MELIQKAYEIKAADADLKTDGSGVLVGSPSVTGNLDQAKHVIFPGTYTPIVAAFNVDGFISYNHDYEKPPIGFPTVTEERGNRLYSEFTFHSTPAAQEIRTICQERLAAGKSVGLSVGFWTDWDAMVGFESGANLLRYAETNGYDLTLFDTAALLAHDDWCIGITRIKRLSEYGVTPMPCNLRALADETKSIKTFLPEGKSAWRPPQEGEGAIVPLSDSSLTISLAYRSLAARTIAAAKSVAAGV